MSPHVLIHLLKFSPLAPVLAVVGGWIWSPTCIQTPDLLGHQVHTTCTNIMGPVAATAATDPMSVIWTGVVLGAVIGVAITLILVYVVGVPKEDLGVED